MNKTSLSLVLFFGGVQLNNELNLLLCYQRNLGSRLFENRYGFCFCMNQALVLSKVFWRPAVEAIFIRFSSPLWSSWKGTFFVCYFWLYFAKQLVYAERSGFFFQYVMILLFGKSYSPCWLEWHMVTVAKLRTPVNHLPNSTDSVDNVYTAWVIGISPMYMWT